MKKIIVADTGPLIGLGRINHLSLLHQLYTTLLIPPKVCDELQAFTLRSGAKTISDAMQAGWLQRVTLQNQPPATGWVEMIDKGEVEAIQLAIEQHADFLLIDDKKGRRVAQQEGVSIIGIGTILIAAKQSGYLSHVKPALDALLSNKYRLSAQLCQHILALAEE